MKKTLLTLIVIFITTSFIYAQEEAKTWTHGGLVGLNFSQSHFDNWTSGGQDNINGLGIMKYKMNYLKNKSKWDNNIDIALGYSYFDLDFKPIKTDDHIDLASLYGYDIVKEKLFITAELTFKSQFTNGYDYSKDSTNKISGFRAPGYITLGLGAQWVPNKYLSINVAPITGRLTIVNDQRLADAGAFGVDPAEYDTAGIKIKDGKTTRWELGAQITTKFEYEIFKNVTFSSKLVIFYDYLQEKKLNAFDQKYDCNVDFDWDNALIMKVNDWLNCNLTAHLIYDENIKPIEGRSFLQYKEVLSIGLSYNIP